MSKRTALGVVGALTILVGAYLSAGAPRLVLVNTGLRIEYPMSRGIAALAAAAGAVLVGAAFSKLVLRLLAGVAAVGVVFVALHLLLYRLEASDAGLLSRGVLGTTGIAWKDVVGLDRGGDLLVLKGPGGKVIEVDTTDFGDPQRATLVRTIARRVRESGGKLTVEP